MSGLHSEDCSCEAQASNEESASVPITPKKLDEIIDRSNIDKNLTFVEFLRKSLKLELEEEFSQDLIMSASETIEYLEELVGAYPFVTTSD